MRPVDFDASTHQQTAKSAVNSAASIQSGHGKKVLKMVKHERMGGTIPVWVTQKPSSTDNTTHKSSFSDPKTDQASFSAELAQSAGKSGDIKTSEDDSFGFGDLLDMINPLHHIPIISHIYRSFTGDQIKPIGRIIGGGVFGGALGAASGLINVVIENETGKDLTDNAMSFVMNGQTPAFKNTSTQTPKHEQAVPDTPELRLASALRKAQTASDNTSAPIANNLPGTAIAFADLGEKPNRLTHAARSQHRQESLEKAMNTMKERELITEMNLKLLAELKETRQRGKANEQHN